MSSLIRGIVLFTVMISSSACSVIMASKHDGVNPKQFTHCKNRACLIASGAISIDSQKNKQGKLSSENFRANLPTGSTARAVMHGLLDLSTLGLWEVAGSPIEASKSKKTYYVIAAQYQEDGSSIKHIGFEF